MVQTSSSNCCHHLEAIPPTVLFCLSLHKQCMDPPEIGCCRSCHQCLQALAAHRTLASPPTQLRLPAGGPLSACPQCPCYCSHLRVVLAHHCHAPIADTTATSAGTTATACGQIMLYVLTQLKKSRRPLTASVKHMRSFDSVAVSK